MNLDYNISSHFPKLLEPICIALLIRMTAGESCNIQGVMHSLSAHCVPGFVLWLIPENDAQWVKLPWLLANYEATLLFFPSQAGFCFSTLISASMQQDFLWFPYSGLFSPHCYAKDSWPSGKEDSSEKKHTEVENSLGGRAHLEKPWATSTLAYSV